MRVIAGTAKGHRLVAPPGTEVRPTSDRVKESLFSALQASVPGARVLDLFAGSGALGIEALSRGAAHATLVERDAKARQAITTNVATAGVGDRVTVLGTDVATALSGRLAGEVFDLVLLDPPYLISDRDLTAVLEALAPRLAVGAVISLELGRRGATPHWPAGVIGRGPRRYGDTVIHLADAVTEDGVEDPR